jgi:heme oxygenase (biliverdin-IX-beta and delta-forming)
MSAESVRALLESRGDGVLATLSARREGWPFASLVQYALTLEGEPFFLLSGLAEHTRNLAADARASLLVHERADGDPLAAGRVTLLGRAERADATDELRAGYLEAHPQASTYLELADFSFWVLRVSEARFVGGFGDMGWISGEDLRLSLENVT